MDVTTRGECLAEEKIQKGIFQGDALSSLLFDTTQSHTQEMHRVLKIYEIVRIIGTWKVGLTAGGISSAEVKLKRGLFEGHVLSPLLFVIAGMAINHILRKYTRNIGIWHHQISGDGI